jgi:peptidoglycan/xylan/chitin deacetylase (PgdA/CDA1 family)
MNFVNPPYLLTKLTQRNIIWKIRTMEPIIYLSFDDGPVPEITPFVLKELDKYKAKATFFCVGENACKHPDILKAVIASGHKIGNHTYNHLNGWKAHTAQYIENTNKCEAHFTTELFRPPYGRIKPSQLFKLRNRFDIVMWSVLSCDYDQQVSKEKCLDNVINTTDKGSIVVFHDNLKAKDKLFYSLPVFLKHFTEKGFSFEALSGEICKKSFSI